LLIDCGALGLAGAAPTLAVARAELVLGAAAGDDVEIDGSIAVPAVLAIGVVGGGATGVASAGIAGAGAAGVGAAPATSNWSRVHGMRARIAYPPMAAIARSATTAGQRRRRRERFGSARGGSLADLSPAGTTVAGFLATSSMAKLGSVEGTIVSLASLAAGASGRSHPSSGGGS
jgi:hypothetical protein